MAKGGARNRSGPAPSATSGRSERRGLTFTELPASGYAGPVPEFPLPPRVVWHTYWEGSGRDRTQVREDDTAITEQVAEREAELWSWAWSLPQAWAWSQPSEAWRLHTVAMWVRTYVLCESSEATAADKGSLHRFADQIGLTPAGLRENGWVIAADEVAEARAERTASASKPARRLRVVDGPA